MSNDDTNIPVIQTDGMQPEEDILAPPSVPSAYIQEDPYNPDPRPAYVNGVYNASYSGPGIVDRDGQLVIGPGDQPYYYNLNNAPPSKTVWMHAAFRSTPPLNTSTLSGSSWNSATTSVVTGKPR